MRSFGADTRLPTLAVVLDIVRERGKISRVELAEATGLTQGTMTHAVRKLIALGFVREVGTTPSGRGSPRRLIELRLDSSYMIGIQFDQFSAVGVLIDLSGRVIALRRMPAAGTRKPEAVIDEFAEHVAALLEEAAVPRSAVLGIGLATHGPQDREAGVLLTPQPTPEWLEYPLAKRLSDATGLPVMIENDATAAGIGVQALGNATASFAVVFISSGIGSGVIIDGHPYRGTTSNGVELGHISIDARGPVCDCGNRGCLDTIAGPTAIAERAGRNAELVSRLGLGRNALADFTAIARAAMDGDADAAALIDDSKELLAVATVTLVNLFDVDRVVLAGNAFVDVGPDYRDAIQTVLDQSVFMRHVHTVRAELAPEVTQAAAIGGAVMVLRDLLEASTLIDRSSPAK